MRSVSRAPHIAARARQEAALTIPKGALFGSRRFRAATWNPAQTGTFMSGATVGPTTLTLQAATGALTGPTGSTLRVRFCASDRVNDEEGSGRDPESLDPDENLTYAWSVVSLPDAAAVVDIASPTSQDTSVTIRKDAAFSCPATRVPFSREICCHTLRAPSERFSGSRRAPGRARRSPLACLR
jgi:hypothetical protein